METRNGTSDLAVSAKQLGGSVVELDIASVKSALGKLSEAHSDTFGAENHRFLLNPVLEESDILAFEVQNDIRLPADYRRFLIGIGNGGAGPYYGVFPLGTMDGSNGGLIRFEEAGFVGSLAKPFPFDAAWNDLLDMPPEELLQTDEREYHRQQQAFENRYWSPSLVDGAIPICHQGCALRILLVLTGRQAGRLWHDGRSDYTGLKPVRIADGSDATFSSWYNEWLQNAIREPRNN